MLSIYAGCFVFGAAYAVLSAFLGHHGGMDHSGLDHSGAGFGHAGIDHAGSVLDHSHSGLGHANLGHSSDSNHDFPSPFNPLVIASAITAFGAIGIIGKLGFGLGEILTAFFAAGSSIITGTIIFYGVVRLMYSSQSNSSYTDQDLIGIEAEVVTPIPEKGMGEISYIMNGVRYNCPAKTFNHENVTKGKIVRIYQIEGRIPLVIKKYGADDLDEIIPEVSEDSQRNPEHLKRREKGD